MAEFLVDPSVLTKEKLKSELLANDVTLPSGEQKKEVYVQLYLKNLTVLNKKTPPQDTFSSDDELPTPVVSNRTRSSGRKASRKTDKLQTDEADISVLSDEDLKDQLLKHGIDAGPIVASTRRLYEKKLETVLDGTANATSGPPEPTTLKADGSQNGNTNSVQDHYSDKEEEESSPPEPEPAPVVSKPVRSRSKTPVTVRTSSRRQNKVEEKVPVADETAVIEEDVLKEMFPGQTATPTGISATCRRPIHGAAGRPVKPLNLWREETLQHHGTYTETSSILQGHSTVEAPPSQGSRVGRCLSLLLRLLVLLTVIAAVYYTYQNVDSEHINYVRSLVDSTGIPALLTGGESSADQSSE
ncbi:thymopoietin b [Alosa pseudoharengus]|uniref:thymopoietin b n=1 Tax=Alosa pseudoharengus TaxID=34774 RepID=UPI003F8A58DB